MRRLMGEEKTMSDDPKVLENMTSITKRANMPVVRAERSFS